MTIGIYAFRNKVTNHYYIGSSKHIEVRREQHISKLRKRSHHSSKFQNAYIEHGEDVFEFLILKELSDLSLLRQTEEEFIKLYQSCNNGYNTYKKGYPQTIKLKNPSKLQKIVYKKKHIFNKKNKLSNNFDAAYIFMSACGIDKFIKAIEFNITEIKLYTHDLKSAGVLLQEPIRKKIIYYSKSCKKKNVKIYWGNHPYPFDFPVSNSQNELL